MYRYGFGRRVAGHLLVCAALGAAAFSSSLAAQQPAATGTPAVPEYSLREHYTKYEFRIPMRDGKRLFTAVYVPKDSSRTWPILVTRTPYSAAPYGVDSFPRGLGPAPEFARAGFIFVVQDVRGRYMSEGTFVEMTPHKPVKNSSADVDESTDMYDSVEWLLKNVPNHNGRVGIWGNSYPGFFASASIIDSHPAIKAASPQAPMTDIYMGDDAYHNGAFMLAANYGFYTSFKQQETPTAPPRRWERYDYGTANGYDYFLKLGTLSNILATLEKDKGSLLGPQARNDVYNDFWKSRNIAPHLKNIKAAVLTVGGWYDAEDPQGPLSTYRAIGQQNPTIPYNALVMGPWSHGGWQRLDGAQFGHLSFGARTGEWFRRNILLPFFEKHLKDRADVKLAGAYVFETGTNVWRTYPAWPPKEVQKRTLYFQDKGKLAWTAPAASAFDEYLSDPARPVPSFANVTTSVPQEYMVADQRFVATRPDVLVYQSDVLEEDVTIAGVLAPRLFVSTTGTDSDFVVKLIDVHPEDHPDDEAGNNAPYGQNRDVLVPRFIMSGYQQLVRGEPMRGKFRKSFEKPEPFVPGQVDAVNFTMPDINHTFRRGHRIMVQVHSSWFPLADLNPQTFVSIPNAKPEDFRKATQRVYRGGTQSSGIEVMVLGGAR